ncbi:peptidase M22, glycoprotease [Auriculariales sp. MPI-PUGE-AT-0066]|nr:peptidase M22, glycoprotease [Auriculariales sp. MPI-PUGE-AT-0066]
MHSVARVARRTFTVLAFESSADDSCAALVTSSRKILANVVIKQDKLNASFGGIHPYIALDQHQSNLPVALRTALNEAKLSVSDVDGIAFTRGPGMGGCLSVSMNAAKALAAAHNKPLIGVHHMQAHALTPFLTLPEDQVPQFPFLTLLISGGHTLLLLAKSQTNFKIIATAADENIGRALDKGARALGLPPTGAALETFCASEEPSQPLPTGFSFVLPMPRQLSFSYAGIRSQLQRHVHLLNEHYGGQTAAWSGLPHFPGDAIPAPIPQHHEHVGNEHREALRSLARLYQRAAFQHLCEKVGLALRWCREQLEPSNERVQALVVSGGVASNLLLRTMLQDELDKHEPGLPLRCPPPAMCTDNAAMIAWASMHRFIAGDRDDFSIKLRPTWSLDELEIPEQGTQGTWPPTQPKPSKLSITK